MRIRVFCVICVILVGCAVLAYDDAGRYLEDGNSLYQSYVETKNLDFLEKSYLNYYKASEIAPSASSYLGMGMVFIEKKNYKKAKQYLYKAYSIDEYDATVNYYLAKFSFENEDYLKALFFYKKAYDNGLAQNYDVNEKIATIYEKVGDVQRSKIFYELALKLNPDSEYCAKRLLSLDEFENSKYLYVQE